MMPETNIHINNAVMWWASVGYGNRADLKKRYYHIDQHIGQREIVQMYEREHFSELHSTIEDPNLKFLTDLIEKSELLNSLRVYMGIHSLSYPLTADTNKLINNLAVEIIAANQKT